CASLRPCAFRAPWWCLVMFMGTYLLRSSWPSRLEHVRRQELPRLGLVLEELHLEDPRRAERRDEHDPVLDGQGRQAQPAGERARLRREVAFVAGLNAALLPVQHVEPAARR